MTFEDLSIPTPPGYINGDTGSVPSGQSVSTPLAAGGLSFSNTFTNDYGGYWTGFSFSNVVDTTTQGYGNQYASYPGGGYSGSTNYAVAYGDGVSKTPSRDLLDFTWPTCARDRHQESSLAGPGLTSLGWERSIPCRLRLRVRIPGCTA